MEFKHVLGGSFIIEEKGNKIGHIDYSYQDEKTITLDSTEVDEDHRGKGLAEDLVMKVVEFARANNLKIIPICPYTVVLFKRKKEKLSDVIA